MLQTVKAEKVDKKWSHLSSFHILFLKLSEKVRFCNFILTLVRNRSLLKQCTHIHLKGIITHFHKMVLYIMIHSVHSPLVHSGL